MGQNAAWVTFHVRTDDVDRTNRIFDRLHADREAIESEFAGRLREREPANQNAQAPRWSWGRYDPFAFASISVLRDGTIYDSTETLEQIRRWMLTLLPVLKEVFDPRIEAILDRLPADDGR